MPVSADQTGGRSSPAGSQLIPMIGMTTSEHGTVSEQPSEALLSDVVMTNLSDPRPFRSDTPYVVLLG